MLRAAAAVASAMVGVGAALCFTHQPSVTIDGEQTACRGPHAFYEAAAEVGASGGQWCPAGCEAEYHRWMTYAGGLGLISVIIGTGAAFYRREDETAEVALRG